MYKQMPTTEIFNHRYENIHKTASAFLKDTAFIGQDKCYFKLLKAELVSLKILYTYTLHCQVSIYVTVKNHLFWTCK